MAIDAATLQQLMTGLGTTIGTSVAAATRANTDSIGRLASAMKSSNNSREKIKVDSSNSVLKAQSDAHEWAQSNPFTEEKHSVTLWKADLREKFTNPFCRSVVDYAGIGAYMRQSNALHDATQEIEEKLLTALGSNYGNMLWGHDDACISSLQDADLWPVGNDAAVAARCAAHKADKFSLFVDGSMHEQSPQVVALRKMAIRQLSGYIYTPIAVEYDINSLLEATTVVGGVTSLVEVSHWYNAVKSILQWVYDHDMAATGARAPEILLMQLLDQDVQDRLSATGPGAARPTVLEQVNGLLPVFVNNANRRQTLLAICKFHASMRDTLLPVLLDTRYDDVNAFSIANAMQEPMQLPVLPQAKQEYITFRHFGRLCQGRTFELRKLTALTPAIKKVDVYCYSRYPAGGTQTPLLQHNANARVGHDGNFVDRYPIIPEYDENDLTGRFHHGRAMTNVEWDIYDMTVATIIHDGLDQKPHDKADLGSWAAIQAIDSTVCLYTSYQYFQILEEAHIEPDDNWERELRQFIMEELTFNRKGKVTYYFATIDKANSLLERVAKSSVPGKKGGMDESIIMQKMMVPIINAFSEINRQKADPLDLEYFDIVRNFTMRYDKTLPAWDDDPQKPKRSMAYFRDWHDAASIRAAFKRAENNCPKTTRETYIPQYDIEARQPKTMRRVKVEALKVFDADGAELSADTALNLLHDEHFTTLKLESDGFDMRRTSAMIADEHNGLRDQMIESQLLLNPAPALHTTMPITRQARPENLGTLRSLAGGPGGPRRFSAMRGQATVRANAPYHGLHPAVGRGGSSNSPGGQPLQRAVQKFAQRRGFSTPPNFGTTRSDRKPTVSGPKPPYRAQNANRNTGRPQPTVTQTLRRKSELVFKLGNQAKAAIKAKNESEALSNLDKALEVIQEVMTMEERDDALPKADDDGGGKADFQDEDDMADARSRGTSEAGSTVDSDEETLAALDAIFDRNTTQADFHEKMESLQFLSTQSTGLVNFTSPEFVLEHEVVLRTVVGKERSLVVQDTGATQGVQSGYNFIKKVIKLKTPITIQQGESPTFAPELGVRETAMAIGGQAKIAFVDLDLAMLAPKVRENLYIKGMSPAFKRGLRTGPQCNFLYHKSIQPLSRSGQIADSYDDASDELLSNSVPVRKMPNGLSYTEVMSVEQALAEGYTLVNMYTLKPYVYEESLAELNASLAHHKHEKYFLEALMMMGNMLGNDDDEPSASAERHVTFAGDDEFHDARALKLTPDEPGEYLTQRMAHIEALLPKRSNLKPTASVMIEEVIEANDKRDATDYFSNRYDIYYGAEEQSPPELPPKPRFRREHSAGSKASKAVRKPSARFLTDWTRRLGVVLTAVALCYGKSTESDFQHLRGGHDSLPFQMKAGCEAHPVLRRKFELQNPHIPSERSHHDMFELNRGLQSGSISLADWRANIAIITTPCINNTTLKDYNRAAYNPDAKLFDEMVTFIKLTEPDIVFAEMTPPHALCFEEHLEVARKIRALGYNVSVVDRLPSDCCGDLTHRDRWIMIARRTPVGNLDIGSWADKAVQPASSILDPYDKIDERLWIDADVCLWDDFRMGEKKPLENLTRRDVGQYLTHAYRFGHLAGHQSEKGTKILDPWRGPLPTTTRFANDIIADWRRVSNGHPGTVLRLMSMTEYAKAASFHEDLPWLRSLDPESDYDGGELSFSVIAGAIPRHTLHTLMRVCCYEMLKLLGMQTEYQMDDEPRKDVLLGVHQFDIGSDIAEVNYLDEPLSSTDVTDLNDVARHVTRPRVWRHTVEAESSRVVPALFLVHCATCCQSLHDRRALCYTRADMHYLPQMLTSVLSSERRNLGRAHETMEDDDDDDDDDDADRQRSRGTVARAMRGHSATALHKPGKVTPVSKSNWPAYAYDQQSAEYRNGVKRAKHYHDITHHSADKMEKCIAAGINYGAKPGDSRYLQPCPICLSTGLDRINRHHKTREVSTRDETTLPGEKWLLDGNDTTVYSEWGSYRSCLHFVDSVSYFRISFPVRTANAMEFTDAFRYVLNFTKMVTGRQVKALYTDYASGFLSDRSTDFLAHNGVKLEVVPPDCHWLNGIAEECIHSQTRMMRVRCPNLKGFEIKGEPIKNHEKWWVMANEHATQTHNSSVYAPLERKHGHPVTPRQVFFGELNARPPDMRAFGEPCYVILRKDKRMSKLHDTAELCRYLFNAGFNPITNVLADCPRAHVVLRANGTISVTAKVVFPSERLDRSRDSVGDHVDESHHVNKARMIAELEQASKDEHLRVQRLMSERRGLSGNRLQGDTQPTPPAPPEPPPVLPDTVTQPRESPESDDTDTSVVNDVPPDPVPDVPTPVPPPPEPPPTERMEPPAADTPDIGVSPPRDAAQTDRGGAVVDSSFELKPSEGALHESMPRASFFKDKDIKIRWNPDKAKSPGTKSGREYAIYSKSTTMREFYSYENGKLATKHFNNDVERGIFEFIDEPYKSLQQQMMRQHADDVVYKRTRLRQRLSYLDSSAAHSAHGGDTVDFERKLLKVEYAYKTVKNLPPSMTEEFNSVLQTDNAMMLDMDDEVYQHIAGAFALHLGQPPSHVDSSWDTVEPDAGFESFHSDSYGAMHDVNEELEDQLLFWLTDPNVTEFVIQLEGCSKRDSGFNRGQFKNMTHSARTALAAEFPHLREALFNAEGDDSESITLGPDDICIDELRVKELGEYEGEERVQMAKAVAKEMRDLASLQSFAWERKKDGRHAMSSKLVLKIKYKADGKIDKFKGRLVARGFEGRPGVDFFGTFAPMASLSTVRTTFAIAVHHGLPIIHCDVPNAFLQSKIDIPQYLLLPQGITVSPSEKLQNSICTEGWDNRVVKLLKSLYGLKSAPQLFNKLLSNVLENELSFKRGVADACLYSFHDDDGWVVLCSEVDDLVITGTNTRKIKEVKAYFEETFKLTDWDESINSFLGINIKYTDGPNARMEMDITDKVKKTFEKHKPIKSARPRHSPLPVKDDKQLMAVTKETALQAYIRENYASIVGAFIYMSITCRPDIAYAVGRVSRGMHNPERHHIKMLEHLCGYMRAYPHLKLIYQRQDNQIEQHLSHLSNQDSALATMATREYNGDARQSFPVVDPMDDGKHEDPLVGMADADYANTREDSRKSISGYCFFVYGCLTSWKSKLQPITAGSTHEAELIAMSFASDEAVWTRRLLIEVGFAVPAVYHVREDDPTDVTDPFAYADTKTERMVAKLRPTWLLGDNQGAIFTSNNPETSQRSKHLEIRWFRIRDYIKDNILRVRHIRTGDNVADFFTKSLQGDQSFGNFRRFLMGLQDFKPVVRH